MNSTYAPGRKIIASLTGHAEMNSDILFNLSMGRLLILFLFVFVSSCFTVNAQVDRESEFKKIYPIAEKQLNDGQTQQALKNFQTLFELSPRNANINYKIGTAYLNINGQKQMAVPYLERAAASTSDKYKSSYKENNAPLDALFHLGRAYHLNLEFDKAITAYKQYVSKGNLWDEDEKLMVKRLIQNCQNAKLIVESPLSATTESIGDNINTIYDEYAAVVDSAETTLIFTSRRPTSTGGRKDFDDNYFEDIYISSKEADGKWGAPKSIGPQINTDGHEASISLSADGNELYVYRDDVGDGNIYVSTRKGDSWSELVKLNSNINSPFRETHASVSSDGQTLYFTSDRSGYGGMDIFRSKRLPSGEWGVAENLGSRINTPYDEEAPFIHQDGKTLFFSSRGHNSMGGYDIFFSVLQEDGKWSSPFNLGFPMNTPDDDYFFVMSADGKRAYYSSTTVDGKGGKDIYLVNLDTDREDPVTVYKGVILEDANGKRPKDVVITVTDIETGEYGVYRPRPDNGRFVFILGPGKSYDVVYESNGVTLNKETLVVPKETAYRLLNRAMQFDSVPLRSK
jgi:tetratricopeptide (TPR) repeat protein